MATTALPGFDHGHASLDFDTPEAVYPTLEPQLLTWVDMHAHNFCASYTDWGAWWMSGPRGITQDRIDLLLSLASHGVERMALCGSYDSTSGPDPIADTNTINGVTAFAHIQEPSFFVPFAHVLTKDINAGSGARYARAWLSYGFRGLGEIFAHGHGEEVTSDGAGTTHLLEMVDEARSFGLPITLHWDIGNVSTEMNNGVTPASKDANWYQLLHLLSHYQDDPSPPTIILCHCVDGPETGGEDLVYDLDTYTDRLDYLLESYEFVYFDIAGHQIGTSASLKGVYWRLLDVGFPQLTEFGDAIRARIGDSRFAHRFVWGSDVDNGQPTGTGARWGVDDFVNAFDQYSEFANATLGAAFSVPLTSITRQNLFRRNADRILR